MKTLLLGSIGTLADTSELQRRAFNEAFAEHGLDWVWEQDAYRDMLRQSGGQRRIAAQAEAEGIEVDAAAIHATKSKRFQDALDRGEARPRPGVKDTIRAAREAGAKVGLVTTTSRANVDAILRAVDLGDDAFDVVVSEGDVAQGKPAPDCYHYAAAMLATAPEDCVAVEDNAGGVKAALAAGMTCYAWPGENNADHDFSGARMVGETLDAGILQGETA